MMAIHGQGSFRDSIGLLDQASNYSQPVTIDTINTLLGIPPIKLLEELILYLSKPDTAKLVIALHRLYDQGYPAPAIASQVSSLIRQQLVNRSSSLDTRTALELLSQLLDVPSNSSPEQYLEICLLKAQIEEPKSQPNERKEAPIALKKIAKADQKGIAVTKEQSPEPVKQSKDKEEEKILPKKVEAIPQKPIDKTTWNEVLNYRICVYENRTK